MKKPDALIQLVEELRSERLESQAETDHDSKAIVFLDDEAANDDNGIEITSEECRLLFASRDTIERLFEALGDPKNASLALFDVNLSGRILDKLEQRFIAVDEG